MASAARRAIAATRLFLRYGAAAVRLQADRRASLVLRYHAIGEPERVASYVSPGISLTAQRFREHVGFLTSRYAVIDLDEAVRRAREGRAPGTRPGVVLTFDDGYLDNLIGALPVLSEFGATATIYVVSGAVHPGPPIWTMRLRRMLHDSNGARGRCPAPIPVPAETPEERAAAARPITRWLRGLPRIERESALSRIATWLGAPHGEPEPVMMNAAQLRELDAAGITVGAHTVSHPLLTAVPVDEAEREIRDSKDELESILGRPVRHFSYPNPGSGRHENPTIRELVRHAGYATAATSLDGLVTRQSDAYAIRRLGINAGTQERLLFRILERVTPR
ncbi:MAG TPA: polysaccharide deacetylase family protein [Candidatus Polarisedimenticolaceae bacterium]